jgi:hypothetical protein
VSSSLNNLDQHHDNGDDQQGMNDAALQAWDESIRAHFPYWASLFSFEVQIYPLIRITRIFLPIFTNYCGNIRAVFPKPRAYHPTL